MARDQQLMARMAQDLFDRLGQGVSFLRQPLQPVSTTAIKSNVGQDAELLPHFGASSQASFTVRRQGLVSPEGVDLWPPIKGDIIIEEDGSRWAAFHVEEAVNDTACLYCSRDVGVQP